MVPSRDTLLVGIVVVMLAVAGCGGNADDATQTPGPEPNGSQPDATAAETDTNRTTAGSSVATPTTGAPGTSDRAPVGSPEGTSLSPTATPSTNASTLPATTNVSTTQTEGPFRTDGTDDTDDGQSGPANGSTGAATGTPAVFSSAPGSGTVGSTPVTADGGTSARNDGPPANASQPGSNARSGDVGAGVDSRPDSGTLTIALQPNAPRANDARLGIYYAVGAASAVDGIESITVDTGGGIDATAVTVANVATAGIDEGSDDAGSRTDGRSLAGNVESGIGPADDGDGFVVPLDGQRSLDRTDELVVVIEGAIATTEPGEYSFSLSVNDGPAEETDYVITNRSEATN